MPVALVKEPFFLGSRYFPKGRAEIQEDDLAHPLVIARCDVLGVEQSSPIADERDTENEPDKRSRRGRRPRSDDNGLSDVLP